MQSKRVNIIILAAGSEQAIQDDGFPMCLSELDSIPLIQRIINNCNKIENNKLIVCFSRKECEKYHLDNIVQLLSDNFEICKVPSITQGAACTALLCIGSVNNEDELLIMNGNELLDVDFNEVIKDFRNRDLDGGTVVFRSVHPRYSYVKVNGDGIVVEASEKNPISEFATAGFYWFKKGKEFVAAATNSIRKDARVNGNFYICPTFNEMILHNGKVGVYEVSEKNYYPLKDLKQVSSFETKFEKNSTHA